MVRQLLFFFKSSILLVVQTFFDIRALLELAKHFRFELKVYSLLKVSDFEEVFLGLCTNFRKSETFKHCCKVRDYAELGTFKHRCKVRDFQSYDYLQSFQKKCNSENYIQKKRNQIGFFFLF